MTWTSERQAELLEQAKAVKEGKLYEGRITAITESTAGVVFSGKDGNKPVKNPEREVITLTVEINDGETFGETFSLPKNQRAWANNKFKLNQFVSKYGALPSVDMKVRVLIDGDGYYRIAT
jgi:hypothetical protein